MDYDHQIEGLIPNTQKQFDTHATFGTKIFEFRESRFFTKTTYFVGRKMVKNFISPNSKKMTQKCFLAFFRTIEQLFGATLYLISIFWPFSKNEQNRGSPVAWAFWTHNGRLYTKATTYSYAESIGGYFVIRILALEAFFLQVV